MKKSYLILLAIIIGINYNARPDEGMWLPFLLGKKYYDMQKMGLKLSKEDLYDINNKSLKDAIVMLDGGSCTGEIISDESLMLTNHHCAYDDIQSQSSVESDYLTNGFWAKEKTEELPIEGKTASFLIRIEDVSEKVLANTNDEMTEQERAYQISNAIREIKKQVETDADQNVQIKSMFGGNEYYMFIYETYMDVRLVGAPPSSIGKFGGDTDNWMWPRHTGDFSLFRVYSGPDGKPAKYSKENIPYKPKHFLPVSIKGVKENDFAMIWGYPGSTDRYRTSYGIEQTINKLNPAGIKLKEIKREIMKADMDANDAVRIQYAGKYAYLGNFWKKAIEESKALNKLNVYGQKRELEDKFAALLKNNDDLAKKYGSVLTDISEVYKYQDESKSGVYRIYLNEMLDAKILHLPLPNQSIQIIARLKERNQEMIDLVKEDMQAHFKDLNPATDKKILAAMLEAYFTDLPEIYHPEFGKTIQKKFKGDYYKYAEYLYDKSIFATYERVMAFADNPDEKKFNEDPVTIVINSLLDIYTKQREENAEYNSRLSRARRLFIDGLREMNPDEDFYPDANSTMRVTYGKVDDYSPADAIHYNLRTFLKGVIEKEDETNNEFQVPEKLKQIYAAKDFGRYGDGDKMPVCFLTDHDITGGNSGSPVINGDGELIGTAFDGNSEAMSGDIEFDPNLQRTIVCDIRYVLLVIDKFADAQNLINELNIVN